MPLRSFDGRGFAFRNGHVWIARTARTAYCPVMSRAAAIALLAGLGAAATPALAIVIRHDRPSERYERLAEPYPAVVDLRLPGGAGTLIAPEWVLTAAHAVTGVRPGHVLGLSDGGEARVADVHSHPDGRAGHHDVALLRLVAPVRGIRPLPPYRGSSEADSVMTFVGRGGFGDGLTGPGRSDGRVRAATNRVERVGQRHLEFRFDPPETATDLEGISGPGDSGGPALLAVDGETFVAGVSSGQDSRAQGREGVYGVREFYMRVSSYLEWIDATIAGGAPAAPAESDPAAESRISAATP